MKRFQRFFGHSLTLTIPIVILSAHAARADILIFHDDESYLQAAGTVHIINFLEQPDGTPASDGVPITPSFNYDALGAHFAAGVGELTLAQDQDAGFVLRATVPEPGQTWIDAALMTPAFAVAVLYGDATTLSAYDVNGTLLGIAEPDNPGLGGPRHDEAGFLGIVSDVPIGSVRISRGSDHEEISAFLFTPVPEPATGLLLTCAVVLFRRRRQRR